jgi:FlaA1/EpsC-like NDP-sugar epimerase
MGNEADGRTPEDVHDLEPSPGLPSRLVAHLRRDVPLALLDAVVVFLAYLLPLSLRFEGNIPQFYWDNYWLLIPLFTAIHLASNLAFGLYGQMWRYASVREARRVLAASAIAGFTVVTIGISPWNETYLLPVSVLLFGAALALLLLGAIRFQSRLFGFKRRSAIGEMERVLVVGAGEAGQQVVRDLLRHPGLELEPMGFVDDDPRKIGRSLHGLRVLGSRSAIPALVRTKEVNQVLLAIPSASSEVIRDVALRCEEAAITLRVLPSVREIVNGHVSARDIRDLSIEDLLGREQVQTDLEAVRAMLARRRVLITGAGGSIGSEIARQVAALDPEALILADHDETHLHDVITELDSEVAHPVLMDVRDQEDVTDVIMRFRPQVLFHAAAHKHVPLLENHPREALKTNVLGTANVADAAAAVGVERFVLISTDKAVRPLSVMGASKWFAEQVVRSLHGNGTIFCAVRFGNVLGSRGSVVPTFFKQIARGGPVTVTDPGMARYFMSIPESVQLVLQASALSEGGEVFTLDMGDPTVIIDLAKDVIRLSGRVPGRDVEIEITGARPGEKLVEEIADAIEESVPSGHPKIVISRPPVPDRAALGRAIREMESLGSEGRGEELSERLKAFPQEALRAHQSRTRSETWTSSIS